VATRSSARRLRSGAAVLLLAACATLACASPGGLPLRKEPDMAETSLWVPALLLLACVAVAGGILAWQRGGGVFTAMVKHLPRETRGAPARVASLALTAQASVHVVRWQDDELLVGCSGQQVTVLATRKASAGPGDAA
jgi:hypothetical protein